MKIVKVRFTPDDYARLVRERRAAGLPSVAALLKERVGALTEEEKADEVVRRALGAARRREIGKPFRLKDLFKTTWEGYDKEARLRAGKKFNKEVLTQTHGIAPAGKNSSGHALYKRVS